MPGFVANVDGYPGDRSKRRMAMPQWIEASPAPRVCLTLKDALFADHTNISLHPLGSIRIHQERQSQPGFMRPWLLRYSKRLRLHPRAFSRTPMLSRRGRFI
jgi:hypothetical protein